MSRPLSTRAAAAVILVALSSPSAQAFICSRPDESCRARQTQNNLQPNPRARQTDAWYFSKEGPGDDVGFEPSSNKNSSKKAMSTVDRETLPLWAGTKRFLPKLVTGAWKDGDGDRNPAGALYNVVFIRAPVIAAALWYAKFAAVDHMHLVLDFGFGGGPMEIPPLAVLLVVGFMLI